MTMGLHGLTPVQQGLVLISSEQTVKIADIHHHHHIQQSILQHQLGVVVTSV